MRDKNGKTPNEILQEQFLRDFNNAKKFSEACAIQRPLEQLHSRNRNEKGECILSTQVFAN